MSLFDPIQPTLSPDVWDNDQMMLGNVRNEILSKLFLVFPYQLIYHVIFFGSMAGYQYNDESDIDINVILNTGDPEIRKKWHSFFKEYKPMLSDTFHPISYFIHRKHELAFGNSKYSRYGVYDLIKNNWIVKPRKPERPPEIKFKDEIRYAKMLEYRWEDVWDEMQAGIREDNLQKIESSIKGLENIANQLDVERKEVYSVGWGIPRETLQNILYKYFEKSKYHNLLTNLKNVR